MLRVLIADDEVPFVETLMGLEWEQWGCRCVGAAYNGAEALQKCRVLMPHIVVTDIHMPVMDGIKLFEAMQQDPELREVPVVIVSTEGSATRIDALKKKGIKGYLRKPFTPEKIRDVIVSTLGEWDG